MPVEVAYIVSRFLKTNLMCQQCPTGDLGQVTRSLSCMFLICQMGIDVYTM